MENWSLDICLPPDHNGKCLHAAYVLWWGKNITRESWEDKGSHFYVFLKNSKSRNHAPLWPWRLPSFPDFKEKSIKRNYWHTRVMKYRHVDFNKAPISEIRNQCRTVSSRVSTQKIPTSLTGSLIFKITKFTSHTPFCHPIFDLYCSAVPNSKDKFIRTPLTPHLLKARQ